MNPVIQAILTRRSVRHFTTDPVFGDLVREIIRAGTFAPSGLNNQPWRFAVVTDPGLKERIGKLTRYGRIIEQAPVILPVFVDREAMYHQVKDHQAMGACIQNMLLAAHSLGLGAVWLGEILKNEAGVREILDLPETLGLMAVIALGHPARRDQTSERRPLEEVMVFEQ